MKNLITADEIKALTVASVNVQPHKLEATLPEAQQRHLRPLFGPALFAALLDFAQLETPDPADPNTARLTALAAQVKPCLAQWALVEAWPNLLVHLTDAGVVVKTGKAEGTSSADAKLVADTLTAYRDTAIWRGQELVRWLESNKADYPAYVSTTPVATGRLPLGGIDL